MEKKEVDSIADMETPDEEEKQEDIKRVYLFNCDRTYELDAVEKLFKDIKSSLKTKQNFALCIEQHYFVLRDMSEVCENVIPQMKMDFAVFVVHAQESRLSINEDNAGIGYAKIYRALFQATGGKVLVVIGGDDNYKDFAEEQRSFLSRWARRKVSSQFSEEYLDGSKSFIFSWDNEHRPIHKKALLHFFDPVEKKEKFVPEEKVEVTVSREDPKQSTAKELQQFTPSIDEQGAQTQKVAPKVEFQGRLDTDATGGKTEAKFSDIQTEAEYQKTQTGQEQASLQQSPHSDEEAPFGMEILSYPSEEQEEGEPMEESDEPPVIITHADVSEPVQAMDTNSSSLQASIAILYRDQSDIASIEDVFGDVFTVISPVTARDPNDMKELLRSSSIRSCFIIVESLKMKEELLTKSNNKLYQDLLRTASLNVEKKIVVILCNEQGDLFRSEEERITERIEKLLDEKGIIVWWKGNNKNKRSTLKRSQSLPAPARSVKKPTKADLPTSTERPINPKEFTLVFKTRLRRGRISYDEKDVEIKLEGWTVPQKMADDLFRKWQSANIAELSVYRENKTGNERTVVIEDLETRVSGLGESIRGVLGDVGRNVIGSSVSVLTNVGTRVIGPTVSGLTNVRANVIGSSVSGLTNVGTNVIGSTVSELGTMTSIVSVDNPSDRSSNTSPADNDSDLLLD